MIHSIVKSLFGDIKIYTPKDYCQDYICDGNVRVKILISCLHPRMYNWVWTFQVKYNEFPDFFLLCGYVDDELAHVWKINKSEKIIGREFWDRDVLHISTSDKAMREYRKYEVREKDNMMGNK